jgi:xylan 1,4-beta-xylosidase
MHRLLRPMITALLLIWPLATTFHAQTPKPEPERVTIDVRAPTTPFPHFWEQMFGSGHAILALRENYREDLRSVKKVAFNPDAPARLPPDT